MSTLLKGEIHLRFHSLWTLMVLMRDLWYAQTIDIGTFLEDSQDKDRLYQLRISLNAIST